MVGITHPPRAPRAAADAKDAQNRLASTVWQPSTMPVADGTTKRSADLGFRSPNPTPCHWLSETTSPATPSSTSSPPAGPAPA